MIVLQQLPSNASVKQTFRYTTFAYCCYCVCHALDQMPLPLRNQAKIFYNLDRMKQLIRVVKSRYDGKLSTSKDNSELYVAMQVDIRRILQNQIQVSIF